MFLDKDLTGEESPSLIFFDNNNTQRLLISQSDASSGISFYGRHGGSRLGIWGVDFPDYRIATGMSIYEENANERIKLQVDEDGPFIGFYDKEAQLRAKVFEKDNVPGMVLFDEKGEAIWSIPKINKENGSNIDKSIK